MFFPKKGEKISSAKALVAAKLISGGDLVATQTKSLINVLNSAVSLLTDVSEGRGPSPIELGKMGDYVVTFAKRVENLYWIDMREIGAKTMPDTLFGPEAIEWRFKKCENEEGVKDGQDLREFRAFQWLLTPEQIVKMHEWETVALDSAKSRAKAIKDKTIADIEENNKKRGQLKLWKKRLSPIGTSSETTHRQEEGKNTIDELPDQAVFFTRRRRPASVRQWFVIILRCKSLPHATRKRPRHLPR